MADKRYFVRWRGKVSGPVASSALVEQLQSGKVSKHHQISDDRSTWVSISHHEDFVAQFASEPEPQVTIHGSGEKLRIKQDDPSGSGMESWYYSQAGEVVGPVRLADIKSLVHANQLPANVVICKEGEQVWRSASELIPLPTVPVPAQPHANVAPVDESNHRVCLNCGKIHRSAGNYCKYCGNQLGVPSKRTYGGLRRLAYFLTLLGVGFVQGFLAALTVRIPELSIIIGFVGFCVQLYIINLRLQNIGMSGWLALLVLVPIANLWIVFSCMVCPEGYQDTKELDTAGKVLAGIFIAFVLLVVLGLVLIAIGAYNIGSSY